MCGFVPNQIEPLYGKQYLPRKFKVGVTVPGDNSIDIYISDIGLVVITDPNNNDGNVCISSLEHPIEELALSLNSRVPCLLPLCIMRLSYENGCFFTLLSSSSSYLLFHTILELLGFNVMVGGGMGRTHNKENTFARAADHLGFVHKVLIRVMGGEQCVTKLWP